MHEINTIGSDSEIIVLDNPCENEVQKNSLGLTDRLADSEHCRTNIHGIILHDTTKCSLRSASFYGVANVERVEHVRQKDQFVEQRTRFIKPGKWLHPVIPRKKLE